MFGILLELLQEVKAESEAICIAKGKNELPKSLRDGLNKLKND